jgi:hypothetical protein
MRSSCRLCICESPLLTSECLKQSYETWYVGLHHGTCAHLNGVLNKSLPSVCVPICVSPYHC